jgi:phosphoglycerol transferase MdoB-like AlkP superfamily enzyme
MSYTTALFGLRIESHPQYLSLVDQYQTDPYPDLGRYLQRQGYTYVQISSLSTGLDEEERERNAQFFGMDRWIRYGDLDFVGPHYGWGPAPPDQYVLNYAAEQLRGQADPFLFFYVTQNSHYPWVPLPEFVDDWRTLNEPGPAPRMPGRSLSLTTKRNNYLAAVQYQLDVLVDFISRVPESENAIFVLLGDHQPQQVSRRDDGFETPLHIISRDPAFMATFEAEGFSRGMSSPQNEILLGHEGLYSLLLHALIDAYGDGARLPPPILRRGLSG